VISNTFCGLPELLLKGYFLMQWLHWQGHAGKNIFGRRLLPDSTWNWKKWIGGAI